jgi:NAD+ kinase
VTWAIYRPLPPDQVQERKKKMKRIGIYAKCSHPDAVSIALEVAEWLRARGMEVFPEKALADKMDPQMLSFDRDEIPGLVDLIVVLGGDGTLISVARHVARMKEPREIPILGINLGNLGFLTESTRQETFVSLENLLKGHFVVSSRMMLEAVIWRNGVEKSRFRVLNDVVINKGVIARIIDMEVWVDDAYLTTFKADGLIIATPTGSTAYNLSAGGPIICPGLHCFVITPICPHMLANRPLIVCDESVIRIEVKCKDEDVVLTADGQVGTDLQAGDIIEVFKSSRATILVDSPSKNYFEVLRTKLGWGER